MRPTPWLLAEPHRLPNQRGWESAYGADCGVFMIPHKPTGVVLAVIASAGDASDPVWSWEHVSVSLKNRCPNWPEMDFIKDLFWLPSETVMQLHVPREDHRNLHSYCLHLWRPMLVEIPRPPSEAVAIPGDLAANQEYRRSLGLKLGP